MRADNMPSWLWDFGLIYEANIRYRTPIDNYPDLEGRLPRDIIEQKTPYTSEYAQLSMYEKI